MRINPNLHSVDPLFLFISGYKDRIDRVHLTGFNSRLKEQDFVIHTISAELPGHYDRYRA